MDQRAIDVAVADLTRSDDDRTTEALQIVSSFKVPKYDFNSTRRTYHLSTESRPLHATADSRIALMRDRFAMIRERLSRHPHFSPPVGANRTKTPWIRLTSIEALRGNEGAEAVVLAAVTQPEEGTWALEDPSGYVGCGLIAQSS